MTQPMRTTSYSEVQCFNSCGRKHYYAYGLKLRGKYMSEPLEFGIMGHATLASYYEARLAKHDHDEAVAVAFGTLAKIGEETESYKGQALVFQVADLCRMYFDNYADDPIEVLAVETDYSVGMLEDFELPVKIDLIYRSLSTGRTVAVDHKFIKDFYTPEDVELMPQLRLYKAGLMVAGIQVDDYEYNLIRKRSTIENKADPSKRFVRMPVPVKDSTVARTIEEHIMAANRIKAWRDMGLEEWDRKVLRNTNACHFCDFKNLCAADLEGADTDGMKEFDYAKKTPRSEMNA